MPRVMRQAVADPADILVLSGWAASNGYVVDEVWMRQGLPHAALSVDGPDAFQPRDITIVRYNPATCEIEEVAWLNGALEFDPAWMDPECSVCRQRHASDDRHLHE